jgi:hypothetical protein
MATPFVLKDTKIWLAQYDISTVLAKINVQRSQEGKDAKTFDGTLWMARAVGLQDGVIGMAGLMDLADDGQDEIFEGLNGQANVPCMVSYAGAADFNRVKFAPIVQGEYASGGNVGDLAAFTANGRLSTSALVVGNIMAVGTKTGTFNGTWRELGAVSATQKVYAQLHATAKTAFTSAVFKVQSADDAGGTNTTDRITFTTVTDLVALHPTAVSGAITQTFWRVICSAFTGTNLTMVAAVGIQ